jgi:hypothetical protein
VCVLFYTIRKNSSINRMVPDKELHQEDVLEELDKIKEYASTHQNEVAESIYNAMNGISTTLLAYKDKKGEPGWASELKDRDGNPLWNEEQEKVLSEKLPAVFSQTGGAMMPGDLKFGPGSTMVTPMVEVPLSIDQMVQNIRNYLGALDQKNRQLADMIGPVALISRAPGGELGVGPFPPYLPIRLPIPTNLLLTSINSILESCRLIVSNSLIDIGILRKFFSVILAFYDILRGQWRDGVLSMMGVYSQTFMFYGMVGKVARWVYDFISPDIQTRLEDDILAGGKSMVVGFWLWFLTLVSPKIVQNTINTLLQTINMPLDMLNKQIDSIEQQAQAAAAPLGAKVEFPRIPMDKVPSFEDIQNFQAILHRPEIFCSEGFQAIFSPAIAIPPLRLAFELLNIPTTPEGVAKQCTGVPKTMTEALVKSMTPTVTIQEGGKRTRKNKVKRKLTRKKKKTI